jgi:heterodisulfide reductase subunit A
LDTGFVKLEPEKAVIDEELCSGCKNCLDLCPYDAIEFDDERSVAVIEEALCEGCGVCVSTCPSSAIELRGFTDDQIMAEIQGVLA